MELTWIEDFLALVECGGFSRAAERRHVTQPAFSRRIRALERWVGAELIDRSSHQIALKAAGKAFRPNAEEALRTLCHGREQAQEAEREASVTVRFASTHMLAATYFPQWLATVEPQLNPPASFQLMVDNAVACERMMRNGEAQILLCHHHDSAPAELERRAFKRRRVADDRLIPVSAPDERGRPLHPLPERVDQRASYLAYRDESGIGRILKGSGVLEQSPGRLEPVFHSHAAMTLATLARTGRGVAWTPLSLVKRDLAEGTLVQAGSEAQHVEIEVSLMRPVARQSPAVELLWTLAREPEPDERRA